MEKTRGTISILNENHLTSVEAEARLKADGYNELPQARPMAIPRVLLASLWDPMIFFLIVIAALYVSLGEPHEGALLGLSVFVVAALTFYQEFKSEKALAALRDVAAPRALVVRSGREIRIPARELVVGDLAVVHEGDRVPADGKILHSFGAKIDESILTGEAFAVEKISSADSSVVDVFSGTLVVSGSAWIRVVATGRNTELGKIGRSLQETSHDVSYLRREIKQLTIIFAIGGGLVSAAIIATYIWLHGDWIRGLLLGLASQIALLPEEFPVVLSVFMALGAWRLSKLQVLVRRPASIERLGAITFLCVDKTGTLTQNKMKITDIRAPHERAVMHAGEVESFPQSIRRTVEYASLACHRDVFDPMENAIKKTAGEIIEKEIHANWRMIKQYAFSSQLMAMSSVWRTESEKCEIASKGAPEVIAAMCRLTPEEKNEIGREVSAMARSGLRVLGVARASIDERLLPAEQKDLSLEWLGLLGFEDPLRPEVPEAIETCRSAGIKVLMMTGDYPETALRIAQHAGIKSESVITGAEAERLSDAELAEKLKTTRVFARMSPQLKLRLVNVLQGQREVVAMTGDGVNDAPSLKRADVGIAMGRKGTDVAREASDIVLLDDCFSSIVKGIRQGRIIYANIRRAINYIVTVHIPIAGLCVIPVLFNKPLFLMPIHIVLLELIIDPACTLLFESRPDEGVMENNPRPYDERLLTWRFLTPSLVQGFVVLVALGGLVEVYGHQSAQAESHQRSLVFTTLILFNIALVFLEMTSARPQMLRALLARTSTKFALAVVAFMIFIFTQVESVYSVFGMARLSSDDFILSGLVVGIFFAIGAGAKAYLERS